jgi:hypothetical protein
MAPRPSALHQSVWIHGSGDWDVRVTTARHREANPAAAGLLKAGRPSWPAWASTRTDSRRALASSDDGGAPRGGDRDAFGSPNEGETLVAANPDLRLVRVAGGEHLPWLDAPETVVAEIERFLTAEPRSGVKAAVESPPSRRRRSRGERDSRVRRHRRVVGDERPVPVDRNRFVGEIDRHRQHVRAWSAICSRAARGRPRHESSRFVPQRERPLRPPERARPGRRAGAQVETAVTPNEPSRPRPLDRGATRYRVGRAARACRPSLRRRTAPAFVKSSGDGRTAPIHATRHSAPARMRRQSAVPWWIRSSGR